MKHLWTVWIACLFLSPCASAEHATAPSPVALALQEVLAEFLTENPSAPGVSAVVTCAPLELDWSGAAGTVAHGSKDPLTPRQTFRIASNTKTYVAAAILRLVEMGKLDLNDTLAARLAPRHLELLKSDGYDPAEMTLKQLLSHTSGLAEHSGDQRYADAIMEDPQHKWTPDEQIQLCVDWMDPVGQPGEKFSYSDTGYILLGTLIAEITGEKLGPAVRHLLKYDQLGLDNTWWEYMENAPESAGPRAHQYYGETDVTDWYAAYDLHGGGGLVTDTHDLGSFMSALLHGRVLAKEETLKTMMHEGSETYRLGLMVVKLNDHEAFGHQGFWNTFSFHIPEKDLTVAGCVLNHHAANGRILADRLVARVDQLFLTNH